MSHCGTCNVALENGEAVRTHYNSELHLTNVRRRVEGLRPLTAEEHRRGGGGAVGDEDTTGEGTGSPLFSCTLCKRTFRSVQTLQAHVRSTAHLIKKEQRIIARDSEAASMLTSTSLGSAAMGLHRRHNAKRVIPKSTATRAQRKAPKVSVEEREEDVSAQRCLLCGLLSETTEKNVHHLAHVHQFTIPMEAHCGDVDGLLEYLARKMNGLMCIVCNEKSRSFTSLQALRDHMREADHEKIILGAEYQEFYDCPLEDRDAVQPVKLEGVRGDELVLAEGGTKRIVMKREADVPRARPRETEEQTERRKAILAAESEALAVVREEQRELMVQQNREIIKVARTSGGAQQQQALTVGMLSNKLHPKGYDGNMMFS